MKHIISLIIGLLISINLVFALCTPHAVQGKVLYRDGTPAMGANVIVTHVESGATTEGIVEWDGGWYAVDLGNLAGTCSSRGDLIKVTATLGRLSGTTSFLVSLDKGYNIPDTIYLSKHKLKDKIIKIKNEKRRI